MSPGAQRIAIAEACGWQKCPFDDASYYVPIGKRIAVATDPLTDLNAMAEAEKVLNDSEQDEYAEQLWAIVDPDNGGISLYSATWIGAKATAPQRAEALLRALGKWID